MTSYNFLMNILSTKTVFTSQYFHVNQVTIKREGKTFTKDIIEGTPIVFVIPYTKDGEIYINSEYRDALGKEIFDCVGGKLVSGEDPLTAAKRELQEEAGLNAATWKQIATWETAAIQRKKLFVFCATDLEKGKQQLDADEKITVVKLKLSEALEKIENGEIPVGLDVAAILLFDKLRREGNL